METTEIDKEEGKAYESQSPVHTGHDIEHGDVGTNTKPHRLRVSLKAAICK